MLRLLQVTSTVMGAAFGLALTFWLGELAGVALFGLSLAGMLVIGWLDSREPIQAEMPEEFKELKTRVANLEFRSGLRDRGAFTARD